MILCHVWKLGDDSDVGLCLVGSVPLPDMVAEIALLREMALTSSAEAEFSTQASTQAQAAALFQALPEAISVIPFHQLFYFPHWHVKDQ